MEASVACVRPADRLLPDSQGKVTWGRHQTTPPLTRAGRAPRQGRSVCGDPVSGKARTVIVGYTGERSGRRLLRKPGQFRNSACVEHRAWVCLGWGQ